LKKKAATYGLNTPPEITLEIEDIERAIPQLEADLTDKLGAGANRQYWNNMPIPNTSFFGREDTVSDIKKRLLGVRVLVLVGMGGIGKTELALSVAQELCDGFTNGALYVDFRSFEDVRLVLSRIVRKLEFQISNDTTPLELLQKHLHDKE